MPVNLRQHAACKTSCASLPSKLSRFFIVHPPLIASDCNSICEDDPERMPFEGFSLEIWEPFLCPFEGLRRADCNLCITGETTCQIWTIDRRLDAIGTQFGKKQD